MMRPDRSVHDNIIYAYGVDCAGRRLVLHTVFRHREPHEYTDVVFHELVAHHFEHVLSGNILFDVEDMDVALLVKENAKLLSDSWRYGWPDVEYRGDLTVLVEALRATAVRGYFIRSSYGLWGWVLAGRCERLPRAGPAALA